MRKDYKDKLFVLYDDFSNINDAKVCYFNYLEIISVFIYLFNEKIPILTIVKIGIF